jgi:hypothetical protein
MSQSALNFLEAIEREQARKKTNDPTSFVVLFELSLLSLIEVQLVPLFDVSSLLRRAVLQPGEVHRWIVQ